jgi:hypothetical protein
VRLNRFFLSLLAGGLLSVSLSGPVWAQAPDTRASMAKGDYYSILVAERRVASLPAGPLYWKIESFPTPEAASRAAAGDHALTASIAERNWLFTLGTRGAAGHGGTSVAEIGPVTAPPAKPFVLRVSHAGGPPGSRTAAAPQAGAEAVYVLSGQLSRRTPHGQVVGKAGDALNEDEAGKITQTTSTGPADLEQIVLSVLSAGQPRLLKGQRPIRPPIVNDAPPPPSIAPPPQEPPPPELTPEPIAPAPIRPKAD